MLKCVTHFFQLKRETLKRISLVNTYSSIRPFREICGQKQ